MAKQEIPMPKVVNVPKPANGPEAYAPRGHNSFLTSAMHEDVGRVMQNIIDLQTEVAQLRKERQEWERRALLAEGKVTELKQDMMDARDEFYKDVAALKAIKPRTFRRVQRELDYFKSRDAVVQTKLAIGAQHFLDCISAIDKDKKEQEQKILSGMQEELGKMLEPVHGEPVHSEDK